MNPTFVQYLQNNKWLVISLIAILAISAIFKLIALFKEDQKRKHYIPQYAIRDTNLNYNDRNITCASSVFDKLRNKDIEMRKTEEVVSAIEFSIKKLLVSVAIAVCITSLVECYTGKSTFLPFNVVPEFIQNSKLLLGLATAVVGVVALFFVYNLVMDICNMIGVTYDKRHRVWDIYDQDSKREFRKLAKREPYNRHLEDVICDRVSKAGKFVVEKISSCFGGSRGRTDSNASIASTDSWFLKTV